jgi:toxin ParE1/3/4
LEKVVDGLARLPGRGSYPRELLALGIREYREAFFKPYRVIYRTVGSKVYVYLIADGRRDMQTLLLRRLFTA